MYRYAITVCAVLAATAGIATGAWVSSMLGARDARTLANWGAHPYKVQVISVSAPRQLRTFDVGIDGMDSETVRLAKLRLVSPDGKLSREKLFFPPNIKAGTTMSLYRNRVSGLLARDTNIFGSRGVFISTLAGLAAGGLLWSFLFG